MELIIFWLMMAGLTGFIASQKNRNTVLWLLAGAFFGIFAVIAIACVPTIEKSA